MDRSGPIAMGDNEEDSFAEALYKEVAASGVDAAPLVDALLDMAPDWDTIAGGSRACLWTPVPD